MIIIKIKEVIIRKTNNNHHKILIKVWIKLKIKIKNAIMKKIKNNKKRHIKNNQITNLICLMLIVITNNDQIYYKNLLNLLFIYLSIKNINILFNYKYIIQV